MNIVITGATSFIGNKLLRVYLSDENIIYAVIRKQSKKKDFLKGYPAQIRIIELDMEDYGRIGEYIHGPCDILYSLAWEGARGKDRHNQSLQQKNYQCTMELISQIHTIGCGACVLAGSQAEYGIVDGIISEETECNPTTAYGKYKWKLYQEAFQYCTSNGIRIYEPRFFSLYGEHDYENTLVSAALQKMLKNERCEFTESTQYWNYLYIDDAVKAVMLLLQQKAPDGVYNIASDDTRILKDYIMQMYQVTNSSSDLRFGSIAYPPEGKVSIKPSIKKIQGIVNWAPEISFENGIRKMVFYDKGDGK